MPRPGYDAVLLITGFPSRYARRMIEHVLGAEPRALLYVLTPPAEGAHAESAPAESAPAESAPAESAPTEGAHAESAPAKAFAAPFRPSTAFEHLPADQRDRIVFIEGDPSAIDLGLSGAEFRQLTSEIDRIHHLAHINHAGADRHTAHRRNVVSAAEILELARSTSTLSCLVFHSTAHVSGDRTGVVYEDDLELGQSFHSDVEETRMQAEILIRRAMRDVPVAVVRPTIVVGATAAGDSERLEGLYLFVLLALATPGDLAIPFPGLGETPLNIVPLDYVIQASHAIGRHPTAPGRTFHLADPSPVSAHRVFELVARADGRRTARSHVPSNLAKALLRTPGIERLLRSPRAFVEQLTTQVRYDTRNTDQILREAGITCPPFESYVVDLVAVVKEHIKAQRQRREGAASAAEVDDPLS